jgi:hypothetical protein
LPCERLARLGASRDFHHGLLIPGTVRILRILVASLLLAVAPSAATAQEERGLLTRNPLDAIKAELVELLASAGEPFTTEQDRAITLVLEESRRASEQLFGSVMDFSDGPPQGEQLDRAQAGIAWMNEDFSRRVREHLTPAQLAAWDAHVAASPRGGTTTATA